MHCVEAFCFIQRQRDLVATAVGRTVIFQSTVCVESPSVREIFSIGSSPSTMRTLTVCPSRVTVPYPDAVEKKHWNGLTFSLGAKCRVRSTAEYRKPERAPSSA